MNIELSLRSMKGYPPPERALEFWLEVKCKTGSHDLKPAWLASVQSQLAFAGRVLTRTHWFHWSSNYTEMKGGEDHWVQIMFPMPREAVSFIEDGRSGPTVIFDVMCGYGILRTGTREQGSYVDRFEIESVPAKIEVAQSGWLQHLKEMEWNEYELFEVPRLPLVRSEGLNRALSCLSEAQTALRLHDYDTVLFKCRKAFEAAAKAGGKTDLKAGFADLCRSAFTDHPEKPAVYDSVMGALGRFAHKLGRHEQMPAVPVSREDAEMMYAASVAVFSALGRASAKRLSHAQ